MWELEGILVEATLSMIMLISVGLLTTTLNPIRVICQDQGSLGQEYAWKGLGFLIILFIVGYIAYTYFLFQAGIQTVDMVVTFILFSGSCFVVAVIRLSLISIKEIKKMGLQERHHALHDALTSLPNRILLNEAMIGAIAAAKRNKTPLAVMLMDLNNFKEVNDTLGHFCGDRLLQQVVPVLKRSIREIDMVARLGGDEFAVILPEAKIADAKIVAARIISALEQPVMVDQHELQVGISIGISQYPDDGTDSETLLQKADIAMYIAKRNALGYSVYDLSRDQNSLDKLIVLGKLRTAIANNELTLFYQPIINLSSGKVYGLEVLTRWYDDNLGDISPDIFIPIAEQSGVIKQFSLWMLDTAVSQFMRINQSNPDLILSVNLSAKDIQDGSLINDLRAILSRYAMNPRQLNIEITENSMMLESDQPQYLLSEFTKLGVSISIDDFGTGFSSLAYLKRISTQAIKIDKSFVSDMLMDTNGEIVVRSIIDIARNLEQPVIAEGIETKSCLDRLKELNCQFGQGYFICKPLPCEQITVWLKEKDKESSEKQAVFSQ